MQTADDESTLIDELHSLSPGKDLLLVCDTNNHNLVQWCVLNNYQQALIFLLNYGCNPTRTGLPDCDSPLALACCLNHVEMIQLLLEHGANPSQTTMLSNETLAYLSQQNHRERYVKLIDLLKYRPTISSLSIVLTFDDLSMFRLLMGESISSPSLSGSSVASSSSGNLLEAADEQNIKAPDSDFDMFREKLKIENYVDGMALNERDDCLEQQQQNMVTNDDLSDYAEHGHFFSFCETMDVESAFVNPDDGTQVSALDLPLAGDEQSKTHRA